MSHDHFKSDSDFNSKSESNVDSLTPVSPIDSNKDSKFSNSKNVFNMIKRKILNRYINSDESNQDGEK